MNPLAMKPQLRREAHSVAEPIRPDFFIQKMKKIRDHRLQKAELELTSLKRQCEQSRVCFRQGVQQVRQAQSEATEYWAQAMHDFHSMAISAKLFVARKCHHQKLKLQVATCRVQAHDKARVARQDRAQLQRARAALQQHRLQVEKLQLLKEITEQSSTNTRASQ